MVLFKATVSDGTGTGDQTPDEPTNDGPAIDNTADINTMPLYAVLAVGVAVIAFASKKKIAK